MFGIGRGGAVCRSDRLGGHQMKPGVGAVIFPVERVRWFGYSGARVSLASLRESEAVYSPSLGRQTALGSADWGRLGEPHPPLLRFPLVAVTLSSPGIEYANECSLGPSFD